MQAPYHISESRRELNLKLTVSGKFEPIKSLSFQIYRLAITAGVRGHIKISGSDSFSITAEGKQQLVEHFAAQIEDLIKDLPLKITGKDFSECIIHYNEFRIIHENISNQKSKNHLK